MTIRKLLVLLSGADAAPAALDLALVLGRDYEAHVEVLHVRPNPEDAVPLLGEGVSGALVEDLIELAERESEALAQRARALYEAARQRFAVPERTRPASTGASVSWLDVVGRIEDEVVHRARVADLVVAGRPKEGDVPWAPTLNAALFESGRPVVVAPPTVPAVIGRRVAIAWNASAEAARGVTAALPLLARAEAVVVMTVDGDDKVPQAANMLVEFLAWHGITAQVGDLPRGAGGIADTLLAACAANDIDLLVIGAYTHSRLREMILGGVTRHVLERAPLPLLMSH